MKRSESVISSGLSADAVARPPQNLFKTPWLKVWLNPRVAIREVITSGRARYTLPIAWLTWTLTFYDLFLLAREQFPQGLAQTSRIPLRTLIVGPPVFGCVFVTTLFLWAFALKWSGTLFGGSATTNDLRAAIVWSWIPTIAAAALGIIVQVFTLYKSDTAVQVHIAGALAFFTLLFAMIWSLTIMTYTVAEVHNISPSRSAGTLCIGALVYLALFIGTSILLLLMAVIILSPVIGILNWVDHIFSKAGGA